MSNELKEWIENSHHIVFFGGAGVSTESNIPATIVVSIAPNTAPF